MRRAVATLAAGLVLVGPGLSGCVAVAVPVVAGAAVGGTRLAARHDGARDAERRGGTRDRKRQVAQAASAPAFPDLPAGTTVTVVQGAKGLPAPDGALPDAPRAAADAGGWRGLVRHVARQMVERPVDSVLPRAYGYAPCGTLPVAVLVDADAVSGTVPDRDLAATSLDALATMDAALIVVADDAAAARTAIGAAGVMPARAGLRIVSRDGRAAVARDRCVVAIVGRRAADFPAPPAGAPPWDAGWFLLPAAGDAR